MRNDKTGTEFLAEILTSKTSKPVWLATQAKSVIMSDCMDEVDRVLNRDDRFKNTPEGDDAKGMLREYLHTKITAVSQRMNEPLAHIAPEGKAPDFAPWFNAEAMNTLKAQLEQADLTTDQQNLIYSAAAKAELTANRKLAVARQDYEFQQQFTRTQAK